MKLLLYLSIALATLLFTACLKEVNIDKQTEDSYDYSINDVTVRKKALLSNDTTGANKPNLKSTQEFISIAYFDLFDNNISQTELTKLNTLYSAFGDRKLIEDMIVKNFLNKSGIAIPTNAQMRTDVGTFVTNCYKKFYTRKPSFIECRDMTDMIVNDASITPEIIYYSFLTSTEYRQY